MCQLSQPHRSGHLGHAVVVTDPFVDVLRGAVLPHVHEHGGVVGDGFLRGDDHAALTRGHVLGRVEAEGGGVSKGSRLAAAHRRPVRLRAVLHQQEMVPRGDVDQGGQVAGQAVQVHAEDGLRPLPAHRILDLIGVQVGRARVDVHEDRPGARVQNGVAARDEGERRRDDRVPPADPERFEGDLQGGRAGRRGRREGHAEITRKGLLEGPHLASGHEVARIEDLQDPALFVVGDQWFGDRDACARLHAPPVPSILI